MERQARSTQAGALFVVALAVACVRETPRPIPAGSGPILVGEFHSLTGPSAEVARALHDGFALAIEERNARGGVHGRPIEVRTFDDRGSADEARVAVRRLLDEDRVVLLVGGTTPELVGVAATEADGAVYVAPFGAGLAGLDTRAWHFGCRGEEPGALEARFIERWRARHGPDRAEALAAAGYDTGLVACAALETASTFDRDDVWDACIDLRGLRGARGHGLALDDAAAEAVERARTARNREEAAR